MKLSNFSKLTAISNIEKVKENMFYFIDQSTPCKPADEISSVDLSNKSTDNLKNLLNSENSLIKKMSYTDRMEHLAEYTTPERPRVNHTHDTCGQILKGFDLKNKNDFCMTNFKKKVPSQISPPNKCSPFNTENFANHVSSPPNPCRNNALSFSVLFESENSHIKNKKDNLIGLSQRRSEDFTNKLKMIIENKSSLLTHRQSLRNQFFQSFTVDELETVKQNCFEKKFEKIDSSIKIDKQAFKAFLRKKRSQKSKRLQQTFLSDSEQEEECLLKVFPLQCKEDLGQAKKNSRKSYQVYSQEDIGREISKETWFRVQSTSSLMDEKTITIDKSYKQEQAILFDKDNAVQDLGKFLYINPKQK